MQRYTKLARCTYIRSQVFALKNSIEVDANEFKNLIHSEDVWKPYLTKILSCLNLSYLILSYFILAELHLYDPEGETSRKITNNIHFHIVPLTCMIPRVRPTERSRTASTFTLYLLPVWFRGWDRQRGHEQHPLLHCISATMTAREPMRRAETTSWTQSNIYQHSSRVEREVRFWWVCPPLEKKAYHNERDMY